MELPECYRIEIIKQIQTMPFLELDFVAEVYKNPREVRTASTNL